MLLSSRDHFDDYRPSTHVRCLLEAKPQVWREYEAQPQPNNHIGILLLLIEKWNINIYNMRFVHLFGIMFNTKILLYF